VRIETLLYTNSNERTFYGTECNGLEICREPYTRKRMSYLEDERHAMSGEIEDEAESMC
jgi:hypothetical protein